MKDLPTNLTGLQAIQWLWDNVNTKGRFIAYNEHRTHMMKLDIIDLNLYYIGDTVSSKIYHNEISSMGFCIDVIMNNTWMIQDVSERVFTKYNGTEYEITKCTPTSCNLCQYRDDVRKDQIGLAIDIEYDEYEDCSLMQYKEENYTQICTLDKQMTGGIRHEWCMANTIVKQ